eukprot:GHVS01059351.1.p1 GENE.GHVS01059351.1~~GHVS01059351.1.p1  ORF type:complete len:363 (+),score=31.73 GHVS01059351.1:199-1287(+)
MPPSFRLQDLLTYTIWLGCYYILYRLLLWLFEPLRLWQATVKLPLSDYIRPIPRTDCAHLAANLVCREPTVDLSVIIPAYNEEDRLPSALTQIIHFLEKRKPSCSYEIIVVTDGCTDNTVDVAHRVRINTGVAEAVRVVSLQHNHGKGFSVAIGMHCSSGRRLLMVDADGASDISDLPLLEQQLLSRQQQHSCSTTNTCSGSLSVDNTITTTTSSSVVSSSARTMSGQSSSPPHGGMIVFGSRKHLVDSPATAQRSWHRNLLMHCFHILVKCVVGSKIKDTQCGFKLFTRDAARSVFSSLHLQKWSFDLEIVVLADILGYAIAECPIRWREVPGSKLNVMCACKLFRIYVCTPKRFVRILCL